MHSAFGSAARQGSEDALSLAEGQAADDQGVVELEQVAVEAQRGGAAEPEQRVGRLFSAVA